MPVLQFDIPPQFESHSPMSRILVAVSSPWASEKVAEPLAGLAKQLDAEVLAVHVSRPSGGQMREQGQTQSEAPIPPPSHRPPSHNMAGGKPGLFFGHHTPAPPHT